MSNIEIEMLKVLVSLLGEYDVDIYDILLEEGYTNQEIDRLIRSCEI